MKIEGKNAIVTGGASGLGRAIVEDLCKNGCKVIFGDLPDSEGDNICKDLSAKGYYVRFLPCDVSDESQIIELLHYSVKELSEIHILVNCAGIVRLEKTLYKRGFTHSLENFKTVIETNVYGTFYASKNIGFQMTKQRGFENGVRGVIVNIASINSTEGSSGLVAYATSKGAIDGMALPMARDLGKFGIRLVTLSPGLFETNMTKAKLSISREKLINSNSLSRAGDPKELSQFALSLIENDYATGTIMRIDGGDKVMK